jgi:sugar O-acyltransferase (sialic acid O-acetyltransferase NeuD family)
MSGPLIIYGAGGLGRELLSLVKALNDFEIAGFVDDVLPSNTLVAGMKVLGGIEYLNAIASNVNVVLAFGDPTIKSLKAAQIKNKYVHYPVLVHPTVVLQDRDTIRLGEGSVICAGAVLTTEILVGKHVLINLNVTIGHDCRIENYVSIMPGVNIAGEVFVGEEVMIGAGTSILNKITIGNQSKVGMGSVVIRNVDSRTMVAGVPAKPIMTKSESKSQT